LTISKNEGVLYYNLFRDGSEYQKKERRVLLWCVFGHSAQLCFIFDI